MFCFKLQNRKKEEANWAPVIQVTINSIEKYAVLINVPGARKVLIAYQSLGGVVSGFIQRYMQTNPNNTSAQMKAQIVCQIF